jgi:hypothetical protein
MVAIMMQKQMSRMGSVLRCGCGFCFLKARRKGRSVLILPFKRLFRGVGSAA